MVLVSVLLLILLLPSVAHDTDAVAGAGCCVLGAGAVPVDTADAGAVAWSSEGSVALVTAGGTNATEIGEHVYILLF